MLTLPRWRTGDEASFAYSMRPRMRLLVRISTGTASGIAPSRPIARPLDAVDGPIGSTPIRSCTVPDGQVVARRLFGARRIGGRARAWRAGRARRHRPCTCSRFVPAINHTSETCWSAARSANRSAPFRGWRTSLDSFGHPAHAAALRRLRLHRSSTGAATGTRWTSIAVAIAGSRPTAARCRLACSMKATSTRPSSREGVEAARGPQRWPTGCATRARIPCVDERIDHMARTRTPVRSRRAARAPAGTCSARCSMHYGIRVPRPSSAARSTARVWRTCCPACGRRAIKLAARRCFETLLAAGSSRTPRRARTRARRRASALTSPGARCCSASARLIGGCATDAVGRVETRLRRGRWRRRRRPPARPDGGPGLAVACRSRSSRRSPSSTWSPHAHRRGVPLEDYPGARLPLGGPALTALHGRARGIWIIADGRLARLVPSDDPSCPVGFAQPLPGAWSPSCAGAALASPDSSLRPRRRTRSTTAQIRAGDVRCREEAGTLTVRVDGAVDGTRCREDLGDRGDTYDFEAPRTTRGPRCERHGVPQRSCAGLQSLLVRACLTPAALATDGGRACPSSCRSWWRSRHAWQQASGASTSPCMSRIAPRIIAFGCSSPPAAPSTRSVLQPLSTWRSERRCVARMPAGFIRLPSRSAIKAG